MQSEIKLPTNRNFGIVFAVVFLIISFWPLLNGDAIRNWSLLVSIIFFILALINSKILTPLNKIWFKFGIFLGKIVSPIVMSIIFFLVITPTGFFMKLIGKDLLRLKKKDRDTYWINKDKNSGSMRRQF
tara:strand:- start:482 stop:868 length:387 start_codon:yes stop_codon:yes gene_type:complete